MTRLERQQVVLELLQGLRGLEPLKQLFWSELNYQRVNRSLSRRGWTDTATGALAEDPVLFAAGGANDDFHVIYARLASDKLLLGQERPVASRLLRDHPYALFIFSDSAQSRWHFLNVKYDDKQDKRRLFRRITIGPEERFRTASERLALLDLASLGPDLSSLSPLAIQERHDEAFDVEAVTRQFFEEYRAVFGILQDDLVRQTGDRLWAHDYALQFLNRCMFLYFVQRKRWLGDDTEFLRLFWRSYQAAGQPRDSFFDRWLKVLFFEAFNNRFHGGHRHFPDPIKTALAMAPYLNGGLFLENDLDRQYAFTLTDVRFEQVFVFLERYNFTISEDSPLDQEVAVDPEMIGKVYESLVNVSAEADERGDAGIFYTPRTEIDLMCRLALVDHLSSHLGSGHKSLPWTRSRGLLYEALFALEPDEKTAADKALAGAKLWPEMDARLREIAVVDPACGSGSFLVGMLHLLDDLQARAARQLDMTETAYDRKKRIIGQNLYGVDVMDWACHVAELRLWLALTIDAEFTPEELHARREPLLPHFTFKIRCGDSLVQEVGGINLGHLRGSPDLPRELKARITRLKSEKLKFYHSDPTRQFRSVEQAREEERRLFCAILDARRHAIEEEMKGLRRKIEIPTDRQMRLGTAKGQAHPRQSEIAGWQRQLDALAGDLDRISRARAALKPNTPAPFVWDIAFVEVFEGDRKGFDIVIGNPPYVRNENITDPSIHREIQNKADRSAYKARLAAHAYRSFPRFFQLSPKTGNASRGMDLSSDLYIYFYFVGLSLLNPKGSFCFITSNSWLDVGYGRDLQEFLLRQCHIQMVLDNSSRRSFAEAYVNTVIALFSAPADRKDAGLEKTSHFILFRVPFEQIVSPIIFEEIEEATARQSTPEYRVYPVAQNMLLRDGSATRPEDSFGPTDYIGNKWGGKYLRAPDIYFEIIEKAGEKLVRLGDIAVIDSGINTRANDFFYVKRLPKDEWLDSPIENFTGRKVPVGCCVVESWVGRFKKTAKAKNPFWPMRWLIEEKYLRPVITSPQEVPAIEVDPQSLDWLVLPVYEDEPDLQGTHVREYLEFASLSRRVTLPGGEKVEALQVNKRPELSKRKQSQGDGRMGKWWYTVRDKNYGRNLVPEATGDTFRSLYIREPIPSDHRLFAIHPKIDTLSECGLALFMNCSLAACSRELLSRSNLGQGGLTTDGIDWSLMSVPTVETLAEIERRFGNPDSLFKRRIGPIADEVKQPDKIRLDEIVLESLGLPKRMRVTLAEEMVALVRRRIAKAASLKPKAHRKPVEQVEETPGIWEGLLEEDDDEA